MYGSNCKGAEEEGVSILHGNRGVYHDDKQPAFKVVYDAIHDVSIGGGGGWSLWAVEVIKSEPLWIFKPIVTSLHFSDQNGNLK